MGKPVFKYLIFAIVGGLVLAAVVLYNSIFEPNTLKEIEYEVKLENSITTDSLILIFKRDTVLKDYKGFVAVAMKKNVETVKPGRYIIKPGMSSNDIVNMLRAGLQAPVNLTFIAQPDLRKFSAVVAKQIMPDSMAIYDFLVTDFIRENELSMEELPAYFIPNSYQVYWNTSPAKLGSRMMREYKAFWNEDRLQKAQAYGLTPVEVSTLASIVEGETNKTKEMPRVAGLYLNRIRNGQKLESDPTVRYTIKQKYGYNYKIKRVLYKDLKIDSPYNTYMYTGLPPGPLSIPSVQAIDAVLNAEKHNYIFMCADPTTGYHKFTDNYSEHLRNREAYKQWLRNNKIYR